MISSPTFRIAIVIRNTIPWVGDLKSLDKDSYLSNFHDNINT